MPLQLRQAMNEGDLKRRIVARIEAEHKLQQDGPFGSKRWKCACGKWTGETPAKGPFGRTTMKARIAQVLMAHGKHVRAAVAKALA